MVTPLGCNNVDLLATKGHMISSQNHNPMGKQYLSQKHLCCKKGEPKKVQVTERPKDVISLWGQEEKLHQLGCIY